MLKILKTEQGATTEIPNFVEDVWINMVGPSPEELEIVASEYGIAIDDMRAALDIEERSRVQVEEAYTLILVDTPITEIRNEKSWYDTLPLGIIVTKGAVITISLHKVKVLREFEKHQVKKFDISNQAQFVYQILFRNTGMFLTSLKVINRKTTEIEKSMYQSTKNKELLELLEMGKSLVYLKTSLKTNERVLERLKYMRSIGRTDEDVELLDDVIIENKQAIEMAEIYDGVLNGMMDAFASVIANNQNTIMQFLAIVTIVMNIPTMIFGAYGMNVNGAHMIFADSPWGFWLIIGVSFLLSAAFTVYLVRKRFF